MSREALIAAREALIGHGAECKEVNDALALIEKALAAPDLQAELDATNKQVEILSDALAESRREVAALKAVQEPWKYRRWDDAKEQWELTDDSGWPSEPVYTTPPAAQPAPELTNIQRHEQNVQKFLAAHPAVPLTPTVQEPIGYLFQHEETGLTMVVDVQQVEWGFEKNNPRHQKIGPVYTTPPAAQRPWASLTDDERLEVAEIDGADEWFWKVCKAIEAKLREKNTLPGR